MTQQTQEQTQAPRKPKLVRAPYTTTFYVCTCDAIYKDQCSCRRDTSLSNTATAISGVALSSKTD